MSRFVLCALLSICVAGSFAGRARAQQAQLDTANAFFTMNLEGFFPGETKKGGMAVKRLNVYVVRRDGKWASALATPTNMGKPVWNTAILPVDPAGLKVEGDRITGQVAVTLVPDPWVPKDQKVREATVTINATFVPKPAGEEGASLAGEWKATIPGDPAELEAAVLQGTGAGKIVGGVGRPPVQDLADASYDLAFYNLIPGKTVDNFQRRRAISIGIKEGKAVSARFGMMDMRHAAYDYEQIDTPQQFTVESDRFSGSISFPADTLDGDRGEFALTLEGRRLHNFMCGTWKGTFSLDGQSTAISGFFRGDVRKPAFVSAMVKDDRPWFTIDKKVKPFEPGEHPRLFFRKADLPELKRRAATPEGQRIIQRLRVLLNGTDGESMPTQFNPAKQAYEKNNFKAKTGAYSISHAAGFGFLYQLTGDRKYADLARQCVELAWKGQRNFDDRYSWIAPGGELRAGPSIAWYAVAYDLCYDGWEPDFRVKVAQAIQNYHDTQGGEWAKAAEGGISLRKMILTPKQGPGSNHYGAVIGGSGLAVLAIKDDPGTDKAALDKYLDVLERQVIRHMIGGWGDGGYYKEGWGASHVGTQGGYLCLLQALRVATGKDFLNVDRPNASFITMVPRALMVLGPPAIYPYRSNMGPTYGSPVLDREGFSHGGHFSEGFGAVADKYRPALLWIYNHFVEPDPSARTFDTVSPYPHRAMLALINWPTFAGIQERNPGEVMPLATRDRLYDYFVFRNRFQDRNDVVTTVLIKQPGGTKPREVMVWGMGQRLSLGEPENGAAVTHYAAGKDGSGTLSAGKFALAVDYSKASGADAVVLAANTSGKASPSGGPAQVTTVQVAGATVHVLTLSSVGQHPAVKVEDGKIRVGGRTFVFSGGRFAAE